jgi:hypothetical protein
MSYFSLSLRYKIQKKKKKKLLVLKSCSFASVEVLNYPTVLAGPLSLIKKG